MAFRAEASRAAFVPVEEAVAMWATVRETAAAGAQEVAFSAGPDLVAVIVLVVEVSWRWTLARCASGGIGLFARRTRGRNRFVWCCGCSPRADHSRWSLPILSRRPAGLSGGR